MTPPITSQSERPFATRDGSWSPDFDEEDRQHGYSLARNEHQQASRRYDDFSGYQSHQQGQPISYNDEKSSRNYQERRQPSLEESGSSRQAYMEPPAGPPPSYVSSTPCHPRVDNRHERDIRDRREYEYERDSRDRRDYRYELDSRDRRAYSQEPQTRGSGFPQFFTSADSNWSNYDARPAQSDQYHDNNQRSGRLLGGRQRRLGGGRRREPIIRSLVRAGMSKLDK